MFISKIKLLLKTKNRFNNPASSSHVTTDSPFLQRIFSIFRTGPESMETPDILSYDSSGVFSVFWSHFRKFLHVDYGSCELV